ncbi:MAG TPA: pyrroloquinoline quinone biosynthesis protein PqqB [Acetobacteraceae bacterium]|jgi:pyrroloquinoline quinone biosynthesis protein B|nr:pyrroloquinoline quinone biosynthesis protein PqqB [Acetobacteraceae bacterium]
MQVRVLGAAAGGGFPQWNSNAAGCRRARAGDPLARPRTQASIAVSSDGEQWFLFNASPDLRQQIEATPCLHPRQGPRSSPIAGVVVTNGDVDAIAGLLTLRERHRFTVWGTARIQAILNANPVFDVLAHDIVTRCSVDIGKPTDLLLADGSPSGLIVELILVPGKVPLYLEDSSEPPAIVEDDTTVGALVTDRDQRLFFIPSCAAMTEPLAQCIQGADVVLFDGTLWADDEMLRSGVGSKTGLRMGHMSVSGPNGTLAAFSQIGVGRKILLHINNSNPILLDDSSERAAVEAEGWEVAYDGMEIQL